MFSSNASFNPSTNIRFALTHPLVGSPPGTTKAFFIDLIKTLVNFPAYAIKSFSPASTVYASIKLKLTADEINSWFSSGSADFIDLFVTDDNGPGMGIYWANGNWVFWGWDNTYSTSTPALVADTWYTLDLFFDNTSHTIIPRINGIPGTTLSENTITSISIAYVGAHYPPSSGVIKRYIDNVKIGTTDWFSNDIFSADFEDGSIVPPFDSILGSGGSVADILS